MTSETPKKPLSGQAADFFNMLDMYSDPITGEPIDTPDTPVSQETKNWIMGVSQPPLDEAQEVKDVIILSEDPECVKELVETETGRTIRWSRYGSEDN